MTIVSHQFSGVNLDSSVKDFLNMSNGDMTSSPTSECNILCQYSCNITWLYAFIRLITGKILKLFLSNTAMKFIG